MAISGPPDLTPEEAVDVVVRGGAVTVYAVFEAGPDDPAEWAEADPLTLGLEVTASVARMHLQSAIDSCGAEDEALERQAWRAGLGVIWAALAKAGRGKLEVAEPVVQELLAWRLQLPGGYEPGELLPTREQLAAGFRIDVDAADRIYGELTRMGLIGLHEEDGWYAIIGGQGR
jgi:hypothetical protein